MTPHRLRVWAIRLLIYLTNHLVSHIPNHSLRVAWYRALGATIGPGSAIHLGLYLWSYGPGHLARTGLQIGAHSIINRDCCLDARGRLIIGDNVSISPEVAIITTQHGWRDPGFPVESRAVEVGDFVWIGMRAMLLPGTRVGRGAVIAAGSVVSGEIPAMAVVAGVPARVVATRPEAALDYQLEDLRPLYE